MLPVQQVRRSVIDEVDIILQRRVMSCDHEYFFGAVSHIRRELFRLKRALDLGSTWVAPGHGGIALPVTRFVGSWGWVLWRQGRGIRGWYLDQTGQWV
jgi:hypothetical protein